VGTVATIWVPVALATDAEISARVTSRGPPKSKSFPLMVSVVSGSPTSTSTSSMRRWPPGGAADAGSVERRVRIRRPGVERWIRARIAVPPRTMGKSFLWID
jgi:hypothetical protein